MNLLRDMFRSGLHDVRRAYIERVRAERGGTGGIGDYVPVDADGHLTPDGREIIRVKGISYALRPDVHAARLAASFAAAKSQQSEPETKSVVGTESLSSMVCPKCGDALQHTSVCPKCSTGKLGYRHRYTCVCGGVDLVSKEAL